MVKKALLVILCVFMVFPMSACKKSDAESESRISSDIHSSEPSHTTARQSGVTSTVKGNSKVPSVKNTTSDSGKSTYTTERRRTEESSNTTESSYNEDNAYENIVCNTILEYQRVGLSLKNSNVTIYIPIPEEWKLEKAQGGYNVVSKSKTIGRITASGGTGSANGSENLFLGELTVGDIKVTHSIDRVNSDKKPSYTRTLGYNYDDKRGNRKSISITVDYQEIDSAAVVTMMTEAKKAISATEKNMGVLQFEDNRNAILILGNSFVNSSQVGNILKAMCGSGVSIEAHSRGYATVVTYAEDTYMMQNIREGRYSTVFMCGIYSYNDVVELNQIVKACKASDTKLAIFPAHNENRSQIDDAALLYPSAVLIDWKAEIDALIGTGVDYSEFCIDDSHKHSTPLAGYVGAHMIYRAVFNKMPQTTSFSQVPKSQIALLGDYVTSGSVTMRDESLTYEIG